MDEVPHGDVEGERDDTTVQAALRIEHEVVHRDVDYTALRRVGDPGAEELRQEEGLERRNMGLDGILEG